MRRCKVQMFDYPFRCTMKKGHKGNHRCIVEWRTTTRPVEGEGKSERLLGRIYRGCWESSEKELEAAKIILSMLSHTVGLTLASLGGGYGVNIQNQKNLQHWHDEASNFLDTADRPAPAAGEKEKP